MQKKLTQKDLIDAADELGCCLAAVKAVLEVESAGKGFLPDGRPKILFEGHVFFKELFNAGYDPVVYASSHPTIVYPKWTKQHYASPAGEWRRLEEAMSIDEDCALRSASWGLFQIMGFNYPVCGYADVKSFVADQKIDEGKQLKSFVNFIKSYGLVKYLKINDWAGFAYGYNGSGYKANNYDVKLKKAYDRCRNT